MGSTLSRLRFALDSLRAYAKLAKRLERRLQQSPGVPVSNPSISYWAMPASPIAQHGSELSDTVRLPLEADVVVIGSGITGAAIARALLRDELGDEFKVKEAPRVVMLEARDACSGATARNGGHITPLLYHDYAALKEEHGAEMAKSILQFRFAHIAELIQVSKDEDLLLDGQCREVETYDVFFDQEMFESAVKNLRDYLDEFPEQLKRWRVVGIEECVKDLQFSGTVVGAIATTAGVIHPYRFVTGILSRLLRSHPTSFHLFTHTPCLGISLSSSRNDEMPYLVSTNKGIIRARHVVHATNAWASHLLPPMRGKIVPIRGHMSAQRPGLGLGQADSPLEPSCLTGADSVLTLTDTTTSNNWLGTRSFVIYGAGRYDYLTQQPPPSSSVLPGKSRYPLPAAEFMFGGGIAHGELAEQAFMDEVGLADDSGFSLGTGGYLGGALSMYFGGWGAEGRDEGKSSISPEKSEEGRVKKLWTGILGVSADGRPWVGRLPARVSGRARRRKSGSKDVNPLSRLAPPGEWISAGYSGEGMVHAYLSATALANMIMQQASDQLPDAFLVTEARWKKADIGSRMGGF